MGSNKSTAARQRQQFNFAQDDRAEFLNQLRNHQWAKSATVMMFANSIDRSVDYVRLRLNILVAEGSIEKVQDGFIKGRPRFIYKVK